MLRYRAVPIGFLERGQTRAGATQRDTAVDVQKTLIAQKGTRRQLHDLANGTGVERCLNRARRVARSVAIGRCVEGLENRAAAGDPADGHQPRNPRRQTIRGEKRQRRLPMPPGAPETRRYRHPQ